MASINKKEDINNYIPRTRKCRYDCGKYIWHDNNEKGKMKWKELDGTIHSYPRCAELLTEKGLNPTEEFKKKNG